jgi:hypothetical protein
VIIDCDLLKVMNTALSSCLCHDNLGQVTCIWKGNKGRQEEEITHVILEQCALSVSELSQAISYVNIYHCCQNRHQGWDHVQYEQSQRIDEMNRIGQLLSVSKLYNSRVIVRFS